MIEGIHLGPKVRMWQPWYAYLFIIWITTSTNIFLFDFCQTIKHNINDRTVSIKDSLQAWLMAFFEAFALYLKQTYFETIKFLSISGRCSLSTLKMTSKSIQASTKEPLALSCDCFQGARPCWQSWELDDWIYFIKGRWDSLSVNVDSKVFDTVKVHHT